MGSVDPPSDGICPRQRACYEGVVSRTASRSLAYLLAGVPVRVLVGMLLGVLVIGAGCLISPTSRSTQTLHSGAPLRRLVGDVTLDATEGVIELRLAPGSCVHTEEVLDQFGYLKTLETPCVNVSWASARVVAPWGQAFGPPGVELDRLRFRIDWRTAGIDPLAGSDPAVLKKPWRFTADNARSDLIWTPDVRDSSAMLVAIGEATDTQIEVADVTAPPKLVVNDVHFESELRNGTRSELVVTVTNQGAGAAYRLVGGARSNLPALHGLRFSFGRLKPGQSKTRRTVVTVPRANNEAQALVVLAFEEAHRYTPAQTSTRFPVRPAVDQAVLAMTCSLDGLTGDRPRVDAGMTVHVTCVVRNEGAAARGIRLHAKVAENPTVLFSEPFDLGADRSFSATLPLEVPRDAKLDSLLRVKLWAGDDASGVQADVVLTLEIARPQICPGGKISRARFDEKRTELRRKLDAGLISKEDFERYEAELVGCME